MNIDTLLKNNARSLYLSAKRLPKNMREPFTYAYLLCRIADTIADTEIIPEQKRLELIRAYPYLVEKQDFVLINDLKNLIPAEEGKYAKEKELLEHLPLCLEFYNTLSEFHKQMVLEVVHCVCFAMEWDLSFFPSEGSGLLKAMVNQSDTERYCDYMGGQPGVFWAKLILDGKKNEKFIERARNIGRALQIVNILRDILDDIKIGRIYLPMSDITQNNLMPQDFLDKKNYKKIKPIIIKWIDWAVENLKDAPDFFKEIPFYKVAVRVSVALPILWCLDTLLLLARAKNLLDKTEIKKIPKKQIRKTLLLSPLLVLNAGIFRKTVEKKIKAVQEAIQ